MRDMVRSLLRLVAATRAPHVVPSREGRPWLVRPATNLLWANGMKMEAAKASSESWTRSRAHSHERCEPQWRLANGQFARGGRGARDGCPGESGVVVLFRGRTPSRFIYYPLPFARLGLEGPPALSLIRQHCQAPSLWVWPCRTRAPTSPTRPLKSGGLTVRLSERAIAGADAPDGVRQTGALSFFYFPSGRPPHAPLGHGVLWPMRPEAGQRESMGGDAFLASGFQDGAVERAVAFIH